MQTDHLIKAARIVRPVAQAAAAKSRALGTNDAGVAMLAFQAGMAAMDRVEYLINAGKLTDKVADASLPVIKEEFTKLASLVSTIPKDTIGQRLNVALRSFDPVALGVTSPAKSVEKPAPVVVPPTLALPVFRIKAGKWKT